MAIGTEQMAQVFAALGEPSRLEIVRHLFAGEHRVTELTDHLGLAQSTVSKHLVVLRECGIVDVRTEGRSSMYCLPDPDATARVLDAASAWIEARA